MKKIMALTAAVSVLALLVLTAQAGAQSEPEQEAPGTIVDVAVGSGAFPTLVAAVQAAGLVDVLSGEGPFTVFAPTEEAFAAALGALGLSPADLLADTELLTAVLTYHVLPLAAPAEVVLTLDGESVATVNGADVSITIDGSTVMVNDATVVATDIEASNGIIHVIDAVLLPPADDMMGDDMDDMDDMMGDDMDDMDDMGDMDDMMGDDMDDMGDDMAPEGAADTGFGGTAGSEGNSAAVPMAATLAAVVLLGGAVLVTRRNT